LKASYNLAIDRSYRNGVMDGVAALFLTEYKGPTMGFCGILGVVKGHIKIDYFSIIFDYFFDYFRRLEIDYFIRAY
jgi:hypothetical protein